MSLSDEEKQKIEEEERYRESIRNTYTSSKELTGGKSKVVAGILAILLGGIGIHKFYLGKIG